MLRFLFWSLLLANLCLFAYQRGYLDSWIPNGHEPDRIARQINADKMKPIPAIAAADAGGAGTSSSPSSSSSTSSSSSSASSTTSTAATSTTTTIVVTTTTTVGSASMTSATADALACTEIGTFDTVTAKRFELQLQPLALGGKLVRRDIQEAAGHMVYIPSQGSKDGAAKKANELRHLGINDFYVIQDAGDLHWGISLGIFKTEEAARTQLANLNQKGVHSARLGIHNVPTNKVAFQLRNLGGDAKAGVDKIVHGFPNIAAHACEVAVAVDAKPPVRDNKDTVPRDAMP